MLNSSVQVVESLTLSMYNDSLIWILVSPTASAVYLHYAAAHTSPLG
jgi:hypothetical protein